MEQVKIRTESVDFQSTSESYDYWYKGKYKTFPEKSINGNDPNVFSIIMSDDFKEFLTDKYRVKICGIGINFENGTIDYAYVLRYNPDSFKEVINIDGTITRSVKFLCGHTFYLTTNYPITKDKYFAIARNHEREHECYKQ